LKAKDGIFPLSGKDEPHAFQVFGPYNIDMASSKEEGLFD
jgi:hypothetical protein